MIRQPPTRAKTREEKHQERFSPRLESMLSQSQKHLRNLGVRLSSTTSFEQSLIEHIYKTRDDYWCLFKFGIQSPTNFPALRTKDETFDTALPSFSPKICQFFISYHPLANSIIVDSASISTRTPLLPSTPTSRATSFSSSLINAVLFPVTTLFIPLHPSSLEPSRSVGPPVLYTTSPVMLLPRSLQLFKKVLFGLLGVCCHPTHQSISACHCLCPLKEIYESPPGESAAVVFSLLVLEPSACLGRRQSWVSMRDVGVSMFQLDFFGGRD